MAIIISVIVFSLMIFFGNVLMFINGNTYYFIPIFATALCLISFAYRKPNCKALERQDFVWSAFVTIIFCILILLQNKQVYYYEFWYLYLITFLSIVMFADSRRFKSLM